MIHFRSRSQKCVHEDILSCPYKKRRECPAIKTDCHLPEEPKQEVASKHCNASLWIIGIISSFLIIISVLEPNLFSKVNHIVWTIIQAISISALASVILAWLVDIPAQLQDYARLVSSALTSYEYLYGLDRSVLSVLRNKVTHALHTKNVPNMPRGLIRLDQKICELLEDPYYEIYREITQCHRKGVFADVSLCPDVHYTNELDLFLLKDVTLEYTIKNPYDKTHQIKADIGINNQLFLPNGCDIKGVFQIDVFQIAIDNNTYFDIKPFIKVVYDKRNPNNVINPDEISYNTGLHLQTIDGKCLTREIYEREVQNSCNIEYEDITSKENHKPHVNVLFSESISVKIKYRQLLPNADKHFTKRLRYSTASYRIDYYCEDETVQLFGQLFGQLLNPKNISITLSEDKGKLSMESFNWLLPGSGAFVVMGDKLKTQSDRMNIQM